jgi:ABC-type glycerol-3-phosphate transport system substrate-binding protein
LLALIALSVLALVAGACAPGQVETQGPAGAAASPPSAASLDPASFRGKTLNYVYFTDGPDEQATRDLIAAFQEETGATVNLQIVPFGELQASLQARLSGGNVPDVARLTDINPFRDELLDLRQYLGADYASEFLSGPVSAVTGADGALLAVPSDLTMNGPLVNVDMFSEAGVDLPTADDTWTFDEMVAAAEEVQAANETDFALALDFSGHRVSTILSQYGTTLIGPDGKEALDPAKAEQALQVLADLMEEDKLSRDFWLQSGTRYTGANEIFLAGAAPLYLSGNWQVAALGDTAEFDWAAVPNPCVERCGGFPGGKFMAAFKRSANPDLAAYFIEWTNQAENQTTFVQEALFLPTRNDLAESGVDYPTNSEDMNVFLSDVAETPEDTYATVASPAFGPSANALRDELAKVVAGQQDVPTAVQNIKTQVAQFVEEAGG